MRENLSKYFILTKFLKVMRQHDWLFINIRTSIKRLHLFYKGAVYVDWVGAVLELSVVSLCPFQALFAHETCMFSFYE